MPLDIAALGARAEYEVDCDTRWLMAHAAVVGATGLKSAADHFDTTSTTGIYAHPLFSVAPEWGLLTHRADPFGLGLDRMQWLTINRGRNSAGERSCMSNPSRYRTRPASPAAS